MRKIVFMMVIAIFALTGCRKEEINEYQVLTDYMKANTLALSDITNGWVKAGTALGVSTTDYSLASYYIIDLRSATDFNNGHIKDAHNVALVDLLTAVQSLSTDQKILCVCYTGQTASRATGLLRLAGYKNAVNLKWGMAAWHADFQAKWNNNAAQLNSANWVTDVTEATPGSYGLPVLETGYDNGKDILMARIKEVLDNEWTISKTDVLANPSAYYINNRWDLATWTAYGHIAGAHRIEPMTLDNVSSFNFENATNVIYCYTGQTSSITTAWMQVLGYENTRSLSFGANGMIWDKMLTGGLTPSVQGSTWKGTGSGWSCNYGYYKTDGTYVSPL